jgi:hypothetical protein
MPRRTDKKQRGPLILRLAGTAIAFGVVAFLVWRNWRDVMAAFQSLDMVYLLAAFGLGLLSRLSVTLRWYTLLRVVLPRVRFWTVFKLSFVGLFASNVLPTTIGGDVVKLAGGVQAGMDSALVTASLVVDRLLGLSTMGTFLPLSVWQVSQAGGVAGAMVAPASFFARVWGKARDFLVKTWMSLRLWFKNPPGLLLAAFFSYVHMACLFTMILLILNGLGETISWWTAGSLWVLVYFISLVPISINGLGLQEASLTLIFTTFAGISDPASLVLALLMRIIFVIASLPGALFLPGMMSGGWREMVSSGEENTEHVI